MNFSDRDLDVFMPTYRRLDCEIESADGVHVTDTNGKRYIDFICGLGVHLFGHRHPAIIDAIERQLRKYLHVSNLFVQQRFNETMGRVLTNIEEKIYIPERVDGKTRDLWLLLNREPAKPATATPNQ